MLLAAVLTLGISVTITAGTWIGGVPELIRSTLGRGAGSFSAVNRNIGPLIVGC